MNTTPEFDRISESTPLESITFVKRLAIARLCVLCIGLFAALFELVGFVEWPRYFDSAMVIAALWIGWSPKGEGIEPIWKAMGVAGRWAALALGTGICIGLFVSGGNHFYSLTSEVFVVVLMMFLASGHIGVILNASRAARYRQIQKYVRKLPRSERYQARKNLLMDFDALVAEGFD
ncbi:hypothetical protein [Ruegeria sp. EL01]|jgi:hypothetical protein|uniref:hypothetical protein n=1 Tax=Ruegeria sp. EL01 TaxID=2107578 RepID=UPI000EA82AB4|nr:hypothetical protein [Ruegeria sp. EL01]